VQKDALAELESFLGTGRTVDLNDHHDDSRGATQLWTAAEKGHVAVVQKLLEQPNIDPNQVRAETQTTPLYIAAYHGHVKVVKLILGHQRVKVNSGSISTEMSPLNKAVQLGREEVVKALLQAKDIDVNQTTMSTGVSPLAKACEMGHEYIVELLLASSDIDVNHVLHDGSTALSVATHKGQDKVRKMLLAHPRINSSEANVQPQLIAAVEGREPVEVVVFAPPLKPDVAHILPPVTKAIDAALEIQRPQINSAANVQPGPIERLSSKVPAVNLEAERTLARARKVDVLDGSERVFSSWGFLSKERDEAH
jgi:hypothetical protein